MKNIALPILLLLAVSLPACDSAEEASWEVMPTYTYEMRSEVGGNNPESQFLRLAQVPDIIFVSSGVEPAPHSIMHMVYYDEKVNTNWAFAPTTAKDFSELEAPDSYRFHHENDPSENAAFGFKLDPSWDANKQVFALSLKAHCFWHSGRHILRQCFRLSGSRRRDRDRHPGQGPARRHVPGIGGRRSAREQNQLGGADHPRAHRDRGGVPAGAEPAPEQGGRHEDAAGGALRA